MMSKRYSSIESDLEEDRFLTSYRYVLAILFTLDILLSIAFIPYSIHLLSAFHKQFREEHSDLSHSLSASSSSSSSPSSHLSSSALSPSLPFSSKSFSQASLVDSIVIIIFIKLICVFFLLNDKLVPSLILSAFQIIFIFLIIVVSFHQTNDFFSFIQFALFENVLYPIIYTLFYLFLCSSTIVFAIIRRKLKTNHQYLTSSV